MNMSRSQNLAWFGLALVMVFLSPAFAQESTWEPMSIEPSWSLRVDLLSIELDEFPVYPAYLFPSGSLAYAEAEWRGLRLGVGAVTMTDFFSGSALPVSVGYTIWRRPYNYAGRLFGMMPEVYTRLTADWYVWSDYPPTQTATLELAAAIDGYGGGLTASVGAKGFRSAGMVGQPTTLSVRPFIGIRVRLLTLTAGF